jgi:signal transduction histidine kinase/predicted negative regulator of RcsB-dependent stress response
MAYKPLAHFIAMLIVVAFTITANVSAQNNNPKNLEKAYGYLHENPRKALDYAEQLINEAKISSDTASLTIGYSLIARIYIQLDSIDQARTYIDLAKQENNKINPHTTTLEIVRTETELISKGQEEVTATELIEQAIKQTKKVENTNLHIRLLLLNSNYLRQDKRLDLALTYARDALALAQSKGYTDLVANSHRTVGSTFFQMGEHTNALEEYKIAETIFKELNDTENLLITQRNISLVYRDKGELDASLTKLNEALGNANHANNTEELGHIYNLIGSIYARMGKQMEALENYNQSLNYRKENQLLASYASTLENISRIQRDLGQYDNALYNLNLTLDIRKELNDAQRLASAYNEMGNLFAQQGNLADALKNYLNSLKIRQEANLQTDISRSLINIGITYRQLRSHQNALKYFTQALDVISDISDPIGKSWVYIHLGNTYRDIGNTENAIANYSKAVELRKGSSNQQLLAQAIRSLAVAYGEKEEFKKAHQLFEQALAIAQSQNNERIIADLYNELGNLSLHENKLQTALKHFDNASVIYTKHFDLERRGLCVRKIGEIQTKLGNNTEALENLELALSLAHTTNNFKLKELTLLALHNYHKTNGHYEKALNYYIKHTEIRDSLTAATQQESIWQASLDLELNKKVEEIKTIEGEVETLRAEAQLKSIQLEQQRLIRNFLIIISAFVLIIAIGSVYGYVIIRKKNDRLNITNENLAQSETELKKTVQTKDKLFSIIAHDLRSPFTALVGLTGVLATQVSTMDSNEVKEYGTLINESSQKLLDLIDNLLHWSRSQTGKLKLNPKELDVSVLVDDVVSILSLQASAKGIEIENRIPKNTKVLADSETTATVVRNIISNAIKFTQQHGQIAVETSSDNGLVEISITDNGIGISPENLSKLFKIEQSYSTKGTEQEAGTGLGLVVCKEFVEKNSGSIDAVSKEGAGTTFIIRLPKA